MTSSGGSHDPAAAPESPCEQTTNGQDDIRLSTGRYSAFASKLMALARERFHSLAATRHSLSVRLLSSILLFSACVTLVLTLFQLYLEYRHDVSTLELQLNQITKTNLDSLAERLWALDENQLRLQLTGILQLPDMQAVEVREAGSAADPFVIRLGERSASSAITREYPLTYSVQGQNMVIGTLYVQATLTGIYRRLLHTAGTIFLYQAAETFLVSLFILYIFHSLVTRHLFGIATFVGGYPVNDPPSPLRLRRPSRRHEDELQRVVTAFNALSDNLHEALNERKRAEEKFRDVIETIPTFAWTAQPDGSVDFANRHWEEYTGLSIEKTVGSGWEAAVHPEDLKRHAERWRASTASGVPFESEVRYRRAADGQYRWFVTRAVPMRDGSKILKWYGTSTDIEDRKRAEQLQADLAHVDRVTTLGELSASLAHEIKQPITATITNANTCLRWLQRDQPDLDEVRQAAERIVNDQSRAAEIIDRLRTLYKKSPPQRDLVDLSEVVREMVVLLRSEAARYAISICTDFAPDVPKIIADRVQLQQVLMNLMLNGFEAMKDAGGVLTVKSRLGEDGQVQMSVSDTGVGLPPEKGDQIFSPFFTTKPQGSGMGLAISRSIIESHDGRLWATANDGRGATFHFSLPMRA